MLDTLTAVNIRDFQARYAGTFGYLIQEAGKKLLVQITTVDDKKVQFRDFDDRELFAYRGQDVMFEFIPVNRGWILSGESPYFLTRVPQRQWRRGICPENTNAFSFWPESYQSTLDTLLDCSSCLFEILVKQQEEDTHLAVNLYLAELRNFCILSKHFTIAPNKMVFLFNQKVGIINGNEITLSNPLVTQELSDLINRNNFPLTLGNVHG